MFWVGWTMFGIIAVWTVPSVLALVLKTLGLPTRSDASMARSITVIVPARNESVGIEPNLRSLLQSRDVTLTVIAVDDRSTDDTGQVMDRIAAEDPRLQVLHVEQLPPGWLGKSHAMHLAAQGVTSEFILFTDGDVVFHPLALTSAMQYADRHALDHLCLLPHMKPGAFLENAAICFFGFAYAIGLQLHLIRTRWPFAYAGVGAFNLVRTQTYRRVGGHLPIAMDVLDDVKLGKLIHRNGGRCDFRRAPDLLSIRWQDSLKGVISGLEKNAFASLDYSLTKVLISTLVFLGTMLAPYVLMFVLPAPDRTGFIATVVLWHVTYGMVCLLQAGGWKLIALFPVAATLMAFAWWRSTWKTIRNGGVRWRESFYPLSELRQHVYR